jgi:hypothetical protein
MKSFLQGKRTLDVVPLRSPVSTNLPPGASACVIAPTCASPQIDVVKQGDKIIRLVVTCTCGERTEIECLYPPGQ